MLWFPVQTTLIFVPGQAEILTASPYVRVIVPDVESDKLDGDVYVLELGVDEVDELDELDVDELDVDGLDELDDDELDESW